MPKKVEISENEMRKWCAQLYYEDQFGFAGHIERKYMVGNYILKLDRSPFAKKRKVPSSKEGLQTVVKYQNDYFVVYILTTYVWKKGKMKESDEGWVFIVDKRKPKDVCFFSTPFRRTANFLPNLKSLALAAKNRIDTMPCCKECQQKLTIKLTWRTDNGIKRYGYKLVCPNKKFDHQEPTDQNFYIEMNPVHVKVISGMFGRYEKYQDREAQKEIYHTPSRDIRAKKTTSLGGEERALHTIDADANYDVPDREYPE